MQEDIRAQNAEFLSFYGDGWANATPAVAFNAISDLGFQGGYMTGEIPPVYVEVSPNFAVIDARSGKLIVDGLQSPNDILDAVTWVNELYQ